MKAKLARLKPELVRAAMAAREAKAKEIFDRETVRTAMVKASGEGFTFYRVMAPLGLNLQGTEAAETLTRWLTAERIDSRWEQRLDPQAVTADGASAHDLIISWAPKAPGLEGFD